MSNRRRLAPVTTYQPTALPNLLTPEKVMELFKAQDKIAEVLTNRVSDLIDRMNELTERWNDLEALTERVAALEATETEAEAVKVTRTHARVVERERKITELLSVQDLPMTPPVIASVLGEQPADVANTCRKLAEHGRIVRAQVSARTPHYLAVAQ